MEPGKQSRYPKLPPSFDVGELLRYPPFPVCGSRNLGSEGDHPELASTYLLMRARASLKSNEVLGSESFACLIQFRRTCTHSRLNCETRTLYESRSACREASPGAVSSIHRTYPSKHLFSRSSFVVPGGRTGTGLRFIWFESRRVYQVGRVTASIRKRVPRPEWY